MNSLDHCIHFGWLDLKLSFDTPSLRVTPMSEWSERVDKIRTSEFYGKDYFHLPLHPEEKTEPLVRANRMELNPTHTMTLSGRGANPDRDLFLTAVLGFLLGLRLVPEGVGHLHRIRHTPRCAVAFHATETEIAKIMESTLALWDAHDATVGNRIFGVIHWYLTAEAAYDHQFERFAFLYSVLDALHVAAWETDTKYCCDLRTRQNAKPHQVPHGKRICKLAKHFGSPKPNNLKAIIAQRHELLHEARLGGQPIGFTASAEIDEMGHSMAFFIEQIILGLLDVKCRFRSTCHCFQRHALDLEE